MDDGVGLAILVKAVDFLFDQGRAFLQDYRSRTALSSNKSGIVEPKLAGGAIQSITSASTREADRPLRTRSELLNCQVNEALLNAREAEITHLLRVLEIHTKNRRLASEQYAKFGSAYVPPIIVHTLEEAERNILVTMSKLEQVLSEIYGRPVRVEDLVEGVQP